MCGSAETQWLARLLLGLLLALSLPHVILRLSSDYKRLFLNTVPGEGEFSWVYICLPGPDTTATQAASDMLVNCSFQPVARCTGGTGPRSRKTVALLQKYTFCALRMSPVGSNMLH